MVCVYITYFKICRIVKKYVGCVGALRENLCLLRVYSISMLLIFLGQLAMVGVGYYFGDQVRIILENAFGPKVIENYRENDDFTNLVDTVQEYFQCCGMSTDGYRWRVTPLDLKIIDQFYLYIYLFYRDNRFCIFISNTLFIDSGRKMNTSAATSQTQQIQETVRKLFRIPILVANNGVIIQRHVGYPIVAVEPTSMKRFVIFNVAILCKMT